MADEVKIPIVTTADLRGSEAAAASLAKVNKEATTTSNSVGAKLTAALNQTTRAQKAQAEQTLKGAEAFEKLNNAARGGAAGILNIIPAIKGLAAAFAANPVLGAISTFLLLKDGAGALGSALGDLVVRSRSLADAIKGGPTVEAKALALNLAEVRKEGDSALTKIAADAKAAAADIAAFSTGIDEAKRRLDTLADAATKLKLAELDLAEAEALSGAKTPEERAAVEQDFAGRRGAVRRQAAEGDVDRTRRFEEERRAEATRAVTDAQARIDAVQSRRNGVAAALETNIERNKGLTPGTKEAADGLRENSLLRAELAELNRQLRDVTRQNEPIIERGRREVSTADTNLTVNDAAAKAQTAAQRAEELRKLTAQRDAVPEQVLRATAGRVRNPADLNSDQEQQVQARALEINRNAAAQEGRQAGESIGEAFGLALRELFPEVSNAILVAARAEIDRAVKAESERLTRLINSRIN